MMNLSERIALTILQHLSRLTDSEKSFAPIHGNPEKYWVLRNQIGKIIEDHLLESIKDEKYV